MIKIAWNQLKYNHPFVPDMFRCSCTPSLWGWCIGTLKHVGDEWMIAFQFVLSFLNHLYVNYINVMRCISWWLYECVIKYLLIEIQLHLWNHGPMLDLKLIFVEFFLSCLFCVIHFSAFLFHHFDLFLSKYSLIFYHYKWYLLTR